MSWMQNNNQLTEVVRKNFESKIINLRAQLKYSRDKLSQIKKDSNSIAPTLPISVTRNPLYSRLSQRKEDLMCNLSLMEQKYKYYDSQGQLETVNAKRLVLQKQMSTGKLL